MDGGALKCCLGVVIRKIFEFFAQVRSGEAWEISGNGYEVEVSQGRGKVVAKDEGDPIRG